MDRKGLKKSAISSLKNQYFKTLLFVFIAGIIINGGYKYTTFIANKVDVNPQLFRKTNFEVITDFLRSTSIITDNPKGFIGPVINNITQSKSVVLGFLNSFNMMFLHQSISTAFISLVAALITLWFYIFVQRVLVVGKNRYFLEQRRYKKTPIDKLLFPFRLKRGLHIAYILLMKGIYKVLWYFTIIGGLIKRYEYFMIPYVLAENPDVTKEEAFRISKEMTDGRKWELFKLDVSLLGWYLLNYITLGFSNLFFFNAYKETLYAEVYMKLRKEKYETLTDKAKLNDEYLDIPEVVDKAYPVSKYPIKYAHTEKYLDINEEVNYSVTSYILFFFVVSFGGWIWEVMFSLVTMGELVNRGTMYGPWLPIYGYGGVLVLILLKPFKKKPLLLFVMAMLLCGIIEYSTALYLEMSKGVRYWNYAGYFLNIHERVCLEGLLIFGLGGAAATYFVGPLLNNMLTKIPLKIAVILCVVLVTFYGIDLAYSSMHPHTGYGITSVLLEE